MASLYDLELQESNNFIHALIQSGETPALKLMNEQVQMAGTMGDAGKMMLEQLQDENSEMGKSLKRLRSMKDDIQATMALLKFDPLLASQANSIFSKSPASLETLTEEEQKTIKDYWLKKKSVIVVLLQKGYTHQELFS